MQHMSYYSRNFNLFQIIFEKMKGLLLFCMVKADEIFNAATQKTCEQTVMDDEMRTCANSAYSLRISFEFIYDVLS